MFSRERTAARAGHLFATRWPAHATGPHANLPVGVHRRRPFGPVLGEANYQVNRACLRWLKAHRAAFLIQGAWFRAKARRESDVLREAAARCRTLTRRVQLAEAAWLEFRGQHPGLGLPGWIERIQSSFARNVPLQWSTVWPDGYVPLHNSVLYDKTRLREAQRDTAASREVLAGIRARGDTCSSWFLSTELLERVGRVYNAAIREQCNLYPGAVCAILEHRWAEPIICWRGPLGSRRNTHYVSFGYWERSRVRGWKGLVKLCRFKRGYVGPPINYPRYAPAPRWCPLPCVGSSEDAWIRWLGAVPALRDYIRQIYAYRRRRAPVWARPYLRLPVPLRSWPGTAEETSAYFL